MGDSRYYAVINYAKMNVSFNNQVTRCKYVCTFPFTAITKHIMSLCECRSLLKYYYVMMQRPK